MYNLIKQTQNIIYQDDIHLKILFINHDGNQNNDNHRRFFIGFHPFPEIKYVNDMQDAANLLLQEQYSVVILSLINADNSSHMIEQIAKVCPDNTPLLILSDDESEAMAIYAMDLGVQDYLIRQKITPEAMRRAILYAKQRIEANIRQCHLELEVAHLKEVNEMQTHFVELITHEFRTPIAIIDAASSILAKIQESKMGEEQIAKIKRACKRVNNLINSTIALKDIDNNSLVKNPVQTSLREVIYSICQDARDFYPDRNFQISGDDFYVIADAGAINIALGNLIANALKYSQDDVEIIFNAKQKYIDICDRGIGIPENEKSRIFEKFYRAKNTTQSSGVGLGLYIAKKMLSLNMADITLIEDNVRTVIRINFS